MTQICYFRKITIPNIWKQQLYILRINSKQK